MWLLTVLLYALTHPSHHTQIVFLQSNRNCHQCSPDNPVMCLKLNLHNKYCDLFSMHPNREITSGKYHSVFPK